MNSKTVKVFAPATISNIGPGFDVLGVALEKPGDIVIATKMPEKGLVFSLENSPHNVPSNHQNVAAHVARLMLEELNPDFGVSMVLHKQMPIGSGLGSSGASCAAAALAVNALLPQPLTKMDLVRFAVEGEKLASGSPHADNVAPSLLGGLCLVRSYQPLDVITLPIKNNLFWVVAHPHLIVETKTARNLLPTSIPLTTAIEQWGNLSGLIAGLMMGDNTVVSKSLNDYVAEPVRATLIPGFYEVKEAAMNAGAIGFSISGSGPSVFAITTSSDIAKQVETVIIKTFLALSQIECDTYISLTNKEGATVLEQGS